MKTTLLLAGSIALTLAGAAQAASVDSDFVVALNGGVPVFGDLFNGSALGVPPWVVTSGSPGPVAGGLLTLHGGDTILAGVPYNGQVSQQVQTSLNLTSFGPGSSASLLLLGSLPNQSLALTVLPGLIGVFSNASGPLAFVPIAPAPSVNMDMVFEATGAVSASINGSPVFTGFTDSFTANSVGLSVVPEPATIGLLAVALATTLPRRRSSLN